MPANDLNRPVMGSLPYEAPTLTRIAVGKTAAADALNSDVLPFAANTAHGPPGGGAES